MIGLDTTEPLERIERPAALIDPPFGTYALRGVAEHVHCLTRVMAPTPLLRRVALALRPLVVSSAHPVVDAQLEGLRWRFHVLDNVCERRFMLTPKHFDPIERRHLLEVLPPGGCFVDVGANAGLYSLLMAQAVGPTGRVLSIEPQNSVYERLTGNILLNGARHVEALNLGVSDHEGDMQLYENGRNRGAASVIRGQMVRSTSTIRVRPLLDIVKDASIEKIDGLKIDIEGHEDVAMEPFLLSAPDGLLPKMIVTENSRSVWSRDWLESSEMRGYRVIFEDRRNIILRRKC